MRTLTLLISCMLVILHAEAQNNIIYKYKLIDAAEVNRIYEATNGPNWKENLYWPAPEGVVPGLTSPYGVSVVYGDTVVYSYPAPQSDTGIVDVYIHSIDLRDNDLSGTLPSFRMDSLKVLKLGGNQLTGIGTIQAPNLREIELYNTNIGSLGTLNLPSLERLSASGAGLSGTLEQWNTPNLKYLELRSNAFTSIAELNYPLLEEIDLYDNEIAGSLAKWQTPSLKKINLSTNQLSGVTANLDYPMLEDLDLSWNQISGPVPNWNFPNIKRFNLHYNNFTGQLPDFNFPLIEYFSVSFNDLSGIIPDYQFPNCTHFDAGNNSDLGGEIPELYAPLLTWLELDETSISGDLKNLNFPELEYLWFYWAKLDGEITDPLDLPNLEICRLEGNKLKGQLPDFNMPKMIDFRIAFSNLEGDFPNADMPQLERLHIQGNNFKSLPDFTGSAGFWNLACALTPLQYDDLLPYKDIERLEAGLMKPVPMYANAIGDSIELSVTVRGEGNLYHWVRSTDTIQSGKYDTLMIHKDQDPIFYRCWITNPQLPHTVIPSELAGPPVQLCWSNDIFELCVDNLDTGWEPGDQNNEITTNYPVSINDFIYFEGAITLDTSDLELRTNGQFYVKDVPLPGGTSGNFKLAEGQYTLSLAGSEGVITGFVNDALSTYVPDIGGLEIKLEDLKLLGGLNANGVSLSFKVSFDNITPSCGNTTGQTTEIKMEGLAITTEGISVDGLEVNDFGFAPGFCLKQLIAQYNQNEDKLAFGLTMQTPFIEVGGGLGFIAGELDSIAMRAVLQNSIIPIGTTGVGIIGCEGRVSNLTDPPWNMRFGGIFSAVVSDDIFQLTTSVEYLPPSALKLEAGDGKFFNPPFYDDWWQVEGGIYGQIDLATYKMRVGGNVKLAPYLEDNDKKFIGSGMIDLAYRNTGYPVFLGSFNGSVTIPELSDRWPFDWLSARIGLPATISSEGLLVYKTVTKYLIGDVNLGSKIGDVQYRIEFDLPYDHSDFFTILLKEADVTRTRADAYTFNFEVPDNAAVAIARVVGPETIASTSMNAPGGSVIEETNSGQNIDVDRNQTDTRVFWTMYSPKSGSWSLTTDTEVDVEVYFKLETEQEFNISATQNITGVIVSWDNTGFVETDTISFFLDDDLSGMDGAYLVSSAATTGQVEILDALFDAECLFYIGAIAEKDGELLTAYADDELTGNGSALTAPEDVIIEFNEQTLTFSAEWLPSADPEVAGYAVQLVDEGQYIPIAMLYSDQGYVEYTLADYHGQKVRFYTFAEDGRVSCASAEYDLTPSAIAVPGEMPASGILVYPNPASDFLTMRVANTIPQEAEITLTTISGREIHAESVFLTDGLNDHDIRLNQQIPSGTYILTLTTREKQFMAKVVILN